MDYINSHTTSLSTDLKLDPESRSRSRTVRPSKGGGWERGVEHVGYIVPHSQPTFKPDPESRAPTENIVLCRNKTEKMFKH